MSRHSFLSRIKKVAVFAGVGLLLGAGLYVGFALLIEEKVVFHPSPPGRGDPVPEGTAFEEVWITTSDGERLHGYYLWPEEEPSSSLLLSHGNGGNVSGRLPLGRRLVDHGFSVLLYDYRGYGRSTGTPSEAGVYLDGEAALAELLRRAPDPSRVFLYGRSLGGAVSYQLAARHPELGGIITDATFTSIPEMARQTILFYPASFVVRTEMNNLARVREARIPKLFFHGTEDPLVPFEMAQKLQEHALPPAELVPIPGALHNNTFHHAPELYFETMVRFAQENQPEG